MAEASPYLELLKQVLTDSHRLEAVEAYPLPLVELRPWSRWLRAADRILRKRNFGIYKLKPVTPEQRRQGADWPARAETMVGLERLNHLESCIRTIIAEKVPGDLIETGVWRGGAVIFMRAVLRELQVTDRIVYAADSFEGLPPPGSRPEDSGIKLHKRRILRADLETVKANFRKYDLLDEQVRFLKGWFADTLPDAPMEHLSLLRLDGDMYQSTMDALRALYPKLSPGGFCIVDDYHAFEACRTAVDDYRKEMGILEPIERIDRESVFWRRSG